MWQGKLRKAESWVQELRQEGIEYQPLCFSAYGRVEDGGALMLERMVRRAARRAGLPTPGTVRRRAMTRIAVEVARRSVQVVRACLPVSVEQVP